MVLLALSFSFWGFFKTLLMVVFILSALLLMLVVLLQEPKGGGLSSAFGGAGAETFGVQTGSVNRFTAWVAAIFMASALLYASIDYEEEDLASRAGTSLEEPLPVGGAAAASDPKKEDAQSAGDPVEKGK